MEIPRALLYLALAGCVVVKIFIFLTFKENYSNKQSSGNVLFAFMLRKKYLFIGSLINCVRAKQRSQICKLQ